MRRHILVDQTGVGESAVEVPSGERRCQTQIFLAASTESARAVGQTQPRNANAIPHAEPTRAGAKCVDPPDNLVARDHPGPAGRQVAFGEMQVGAAHTAAADCYPKLSRAGFRALALDSPQWTLINRSALLDGPGNHDVILRLLRPSVLVAWVVAA